MKKVLVRMTMAAMLVLAFSMFAAAASQTWTGWLSDSGCGAKGAKAAHKDCAIKCVSTKGAKWVLVNSADQKVVAIHNQDAVSEANAGMEVKVTGSLMDDGSIHVDSIAAAQ